MDLYISSIYLERTEMALCYMLLLRKESTKDPTTVEPASIQALLLFVCSNSVQVLQPRWIKSSVGGRVRCRGGTHFVCDITAYRHIDAFRIGSSI